MVSLAMLELLASAARTLPTRQSDSHRLGTTLTFMANLSLFPLLQIEYRRSLRPADSAVVYLLASSVSNVLALGSSARAESASTQALMLVLVLCLKVALIVLENRRKVDVLLQIDKQRASYQLAGILSRAFFGWINPILAHGYYIG